jgi:hypothetical protein
MSCSALSVYDIISEARGLGVATAARVTTCELPS